MGVHKKIKAIFTGRWKATSPGNGERQNATDSTPPRVDGAQPAGDADNAGHATSTSERIPIQPGKNYGLTPLHIPPSLSTTGVDVVFLHGLMGNAYDTWHQKKKDVYWPWDLLKNDARDIRTFTFGYDADLASFWGGVSQNRLGMHASNLIGALATARAETNTKQRQIIFVVHSLGGLVVEQALQLSESNAEAHLKTIEACTIGILFFGTPHRGSDLTSFASSMAHLLHFATGKRVGTAILEPLKKNSQVLLSVENWFAQWLRRRAEHNTIQITSFYEEDSLPQIGHVVDETSVTVPGYSVFSIAGNHMDMVKFSGVDDAGYRAARGEILRWAKTEGADDDRLQKFFAKLQTMNIDYYIEHAKKPQDGTFRWIKDLPALRGFGHGHSPRLVHITGKPGCGKSVLAPWLFRDVNEANLFDVVAFYVCNGRDATRCTTEAILSSLVLQLSNDERLRKLLGALLINEDLSPPRCRLLAKMYELSLQQSSLRTFVLIDALDECDAGSDRDELVRLLGTAIPGATIVVLSRAYWNIAFRAFWGNEGSYFHIDLDEEKAMQHDLKAFTTQKVAYLVQQRPSLAAYKEELIVQLHNRASNGMFLMVELLVHLLNTSTDSSALGIGKVIISLPSTLQDIYENIWQTIDRESQERARHILKWILNTSHPLKKDELADALAHERVFADDTDQLSLKKARPMDLVGDLRRLFGPLIHVGAKPDFRIELSHQTVKEYFLPHEDDPRYAEIGRSFAGTDPHIEIALVCLFCIVHARKKIVGHRPPSFFKAATIISRGPEGSSPFYLYARMSTLDHFKKALHRKESPSKISQFETFYQRTWGTPVRKHPSFNIHRRVMAYRGLSGSDSDTSSGRQHMAVLHAASSSELESESAGEVEADHQL